MRYLLIVTAALCGCRPAYTDDEIVACYNAARSEYTDVLNKAYMFQYAHSKKCLEIFKEYGQ